MVRAAPRGQPNCTSTLPACTVVWRAACYRHRSCSPYLLCPRRPAGDTFLSLNLLLNESPLRSRRSICVSTGAPFHPLTSGGLAASPCRATNITTGLSVQVPSICRSSRCRWRLVFDENSGRPTGSVHLYVARTARAAFGGSRPRLSAAPGLCTAVANACAGAVLQPSAMHAQCSAVPHVYLDQGRSEGPAQAAQRSRLAL